MSAGSPEEVVSLGFALHARGCGDASATFDAEGRLLSFRLAGVHFRRGLDGSVVRLVPAGTDPAGAWRVRREERPDDVLDVLADALGDLPERAATRRARELAVRAARGMSERWAGDVQRFREVLGCVPIVPPFHVRSVVLRLTEGCGYGRCRFCSLYERVPFRVRSPDEWRAHVAAVLAWFGDGAGLRPSLWIGDASLLEAGDDALPGALAALREQVSILTPDAPAGALRADPRAFEGIYAFADVPRAHRLAAQTGAALASGGVRRLYLGMESGHRPLLRQLRKPHDGAQVADAVRRLHDAGIAAGLVVLVGAGGVGFAEAHRRDTVGLVARLDLRRGDVVLLSPLDAHARQGAAAGESPLDDLALAAETARLTDELQAVLPRGVRAADYGLEGFVY